MWRYFPQRNLLLYSLFTKNISLNAQFEGCLTARLLLEITWNANLMQLGNFINVFLVQHVSGTYAHNQQHWKLSCSIWFSAPSFWMGGGLESRCVGRVYGAENHMLQLNFQCSWLWAYVPETCWTKNTLIKLPCCIKLAFQVIAQIIHCTIKQLVI